MNTENYITVTDLNKYIKSLVDNNSHLKNVYLKGEISNFKAHSRGHWYFTLKDENSRINAIMFASSTTKIKFTPIDGMKVLVTGRISVYEASGAYQIYVTDMLEDGIGNLHIAFEQLKAKLEKEGLFDSRYKKRIPKIPKRIGIVTAPTGAAIKDILSTIKRRFPICETILFPALVQGEGAAPSIVNQINTAQNYDLDVLIVGRGGGSIEDLWAFNEEIVARAIFDSKIPVISAVGHEIDFTISDFVADLRAPTPTGAAEMAVPNLVDILNYISQVRIRLNEGLNKKIEYLKLLLNKYKNSYILKNPISMYEIKEQKLDTIIDRFNNYIKQKLEMENIRLNQIKSNYALNNPKNLYEIKEQKLDTIIDRFNNYIKQKLEKENTRLNQIKSNYALNNPKNLYELKRNNVNELVNHLVNNTNNIIQQNKIILAKHDLKHIYNLTNHYIKINDLKISNMIDKLNVLNPLNSLKRGYAIIRKDNQVIKELKDLKTNDNIKIELSNGYINSTINEVKMKEGI